jgi:hypothetical protein
VSSTYTVDLLARGQTSRSPSTGFWGESHERPIEKAFDLVRMVRVAGLAVSLAISPVTTMSDPWLNERRRRDAVVTVSIYQEFLGRFISRSEALRLARQILEQAEQERLVIATLEAARGINWEDQP